jgi:hypothetical protein
MQKCDVFSALRPARAGDEIGRHNKHHAHNARKRVLAALDQPALASIDVEPPAVAGGEKFR